MFVCVENMINEVLMKLDDVFIVLSGEIVEVMNIDVEGRLVFVDVVFYVN